MSIAQLGLTGTPSKQYSVSPKRAAATITKSIGTSSRDYSTMTAWEADLDNTLVYVSGDDAVGECYNDSTFDETVAINGGTTVGLNSIELTVADGERHDGTAGSGVRILASSGRNIAVYLTIPVYVKWLELNLNGFTAQQVFYAGNGNNIDYITGSNLIFHNSGSSGSQQNRAVWGTGSLTVHNTIIYDLKRGTNVSNGTYSGVATTSNRNIKVFNTTVYNCGNARNAAGNDARGISVGDDEAADSIKNCIAVDTYVTDGSSTASDFNLGVNSTSDYNLSSDDTADDLGSNSLINKTSTNQFVSIVSGSEDLHLKAGSDAIGAGTDLGTTPDGVQYDIDGFDRDAANRVWDIGADQAAATVTKTIGTTARDYSTMTLWEADLDDSTVYQSGDDAVGECYNDSAFDESVTINNAPDSVGLGDVTLTVADGERHDGTEGTGARIVRTSGGSSSIAQTLRPQFGTMTIEWLEIDHNGNNDNGQGAVRLSGSGGTTSTYRVAKNLIVHGVNGYGRCMGIYSSISGGTGYIFNCFVYDISATFNDTIYAGAGIYSVNYTETYNCSVLNTDRGVVLSGANPITNNVISCDASDDDDFVLSGTYSHLLSSDTSATGTGSLISKASSDQFVSTVSGSEDLHLKAGSDAIGAGIDLGTTPAGVEIDIDGRDRDAEGDTWSIGADQFVEILHSKGKNFLIFFY